MTSNPAIQPIANRRLARIQQERKRAAMPYGAVQTWTRNYAVRAASMVARKRLPGLRLLTGQMTRIQALLAVSYAKNKPNATLDQPPYGGLIVRYSVVQPSDGRSRRL